MSQLGKRLMVAGWGIPLLLGIIVLGGWIFTAAIAVIAVVSQWEFYKLGKVEGIPAKAGLAAGILLPFAVHLFGMAGIFYVLIAAAIALVMYLPACKLEGIQDKFGVILAGIIYPAGFLSLLVPLRDAEWGSKFGGASVIFFLLSCIWICDTAAYFGGMKFGKHKLAPVVSPKKTWEGAIFGLAGGLIYGIIAGYVLNPALTIGEALILAAITGTMGQMGDLAESCFKRSAGVKDSGTLFGPHGGMLDRFDSLTASAPAFYLYLLAVDRL